MPRPGEAHPVADGYVFAAISKGEVWYRGPQGVFTEQHLTDRVANDAAVEAKIAAVAKPKKAKPKNDEEE